MDGQKEVMVSTVHSAEMVEVSKKDFARNG
jgi:hypothetical protein